MFQIKALDLNKNTLHIMCHLFCSEEILRRGPDSSVGIVTGHGLDHPGIEYQWGDCPDRPWGPPSLLYNEHRVFPGG